MTPPGKYTEAFFKFLGWEHKRILEDDDYSPEMDEYKWRWVTKDDKYHLLLPPLHHELEGLGLQEKYLWPALFKKEIYILDMDYWPQEKLYRCRIQGMVVSETAKAPTKALAQLIAGCKALGIEVE